MPKWLGGLLAQCKQNATAFIAGNLVLDLVFANKSSIQVCFSIRTLAENSCEQFILMKHNIILGYEYKGNSFPCVYRCVCERVCVKAARFTRHTAMQPPTIRLSGSRGSVETHVTHTRAADKHTSGIISYTYICMYCSERTNNVMYVTGIRQQVDGSRHTAHSTTVDENR